MCSDSHRRCSVTIDDLRDFVKFTGKHLCQSLTGPQACNFNKKETLTQVFSCEICENSKNTFCHTTPPACNFTKKETLAQVFSCEFCKMSQNTFCYRTPPMAASVCCRRKAVAVKIEKLKAFIINYYDISKTYYVQFHLFYSVYLPYSYFFFYPWFSVINSP